MSAAPTATRTIVSIRTPAAVSTAPVAARSLPGYGDGEVAVQDAGAQYAAPLLANALGNAATTVPRSWFRSS